MITNYYIYYYEPLNCWRIRAAEAFTIDAVTFPAINMDRDFFDLEEACIAI